MIESQNIIEQLEKRLKNYSFDRKSQNIGTVISNTDNVIVASGL